MADLILLLLGLAIFAGFFVLLYLFLDTCVNRKAELYNEQVRRKIDAIVSERLDLLKSISDTSRPESVRSRIQALHRFTAEVKKF
ncbi:MAG TPA: hypothetical protein VGE06_06260 [Flavisolibacter sp.]